MVEGRATTNNEKTVGRFAARIAAWRGDGASMTIAWLALALLALMLAAITIGKYPLSAGDMTDAVWRAMTATSWGIAESSGMLN